MIMVLGACTSGYNVSVNLGEEEKKSIEADIIKQQDDIKNYKAEDGSIPSASIISLALDYEKMGKLGKAISLYESWLKKGYRAFALINNLGKLYEKVGETDKAVEQYLRLINEYQEDRYLYDITWAYINGKDRRNAEKYFNLWQLKFSKTDEQTQTAIKKLREEEKQK